MPCPEEYLYTASAGLPFLAHNAGFERAISTTIMQPKFGWPVLPLEQWVCTASMAAAMALPRGLDGAAQVMGIAERKDKEGHALMLRMARRRSKTKIRCHVCGLMSCDHHEMFKTSLVWWTDEDRMQRLFRYCVQDVVTERALCHVLRPLSEYQRAVWLLNCRMNERGIYVDRPFVKQAAAMVKEISADLNAELQQLTDEFVRTTNQTKKLTVWLTCHGVPIESLRKTVVADLLAKGIPDEKMQSIVELRQEGAKGSTSKFNALINRTCLDSRIRDNLMYHAASTGRFGGKGFQPQNLMRLVQEFTPYLPRAIDMIRNNCTRAEFVIAIKGWEKEYNDAAAKKDKPYLPFRPLDIIACCLRPCLTAAPGHILFLADYNAVEARGTAWLANAVRLLGVFERGEDPYLYQACGIYKVPQGTFNKDDHPKERQLGKKTILGCGYQMGWPKFQASCLLELPPIFLTDEEAENAVKSYREENPEIPELWKDLEHGAFRAVSDASCPVVDCAGGKIRWARRGSWLYMRLPSGRVLSYADPKIVQRDMPWLDAKTGKQAKKWCVSFMGVDGMTKQWRRQYGYGGLWTENAVQGLCCDYLCEGMLDLEDAGYPLVLSVHDEAVSELPIPCGITDLGAAIEGFGSIKEFEHIMAAPRNWSAGFPNLAEGEFGERYKLGKKAPK
jgi:DNA polymerase